jgi:hypothetical protein
MKVVDVVGLEEPIKEKKKPRQNLSTSFKSLMIFSS